MDDAIDEMGKKYKISLKEMARKVKKFSKNDGGISKGHRTQLAGVLNAQSWFNWSDKVNDNIRFNP